MESVKSLIDKASKVCGGDSALAKKLNVSRALVSLMRSGNRQITPEIAAQLADMAGEDGAQAALDAMIERAKGTRMERVLREILGKAVAVGVAGMLVFSYSGDSKAAMDQKQKSLDNSTAYTSYLLGSSPLPFEKPAEKENQSDQSSQFEPVPAPCAGVSLTL